MSGIERIVYFGTPELAVPALEALIAAGRAPALVVTRPARPAGRGQALTEPPVALEARRHGLPLAQPERVKEPAFLDRLEAIAPDLAVVVAFGQIFPPRLLELPRLGCVNLHASLLPRWRGAAPIQAAIAAGDGVTGVTTMQMEPGLDSGPLLLQQEVEIGERETAGELAVRLARRGAELVVATVGGLERGELAARPQDEARATYAPRLSRQDGEVDWRLPARDLANRLRAFTPWPGLTTTHGGRPLKLLRAQPRDGSPQPLAPPGTFLGLDGGRALVACGAESALELAEVQRPGKRPLPAADFVHGERLHAGDRLG